MYSRPTVIALHDSLIVVAAARLSATEAARDEQLREKVRAVVDDLKNWNVEGVDGQLCWRWTRRASDDSDRICRAHQRVCRLGR
jgi:hypothetical protein